MSTAKQRRGYAGVGKLRRTLRRLEPELTQELRSTIEKGAKAIEFDMLAMIPKRTSITAMQISSKVARDGLTAQIGFIGKKARERGFVARFIEYGTKGGNGHPGMPATPFMGPAFDSNRDWIVRDVRRQTAEVIRRVAEGDGVAEDG